MSSFARVLVKPGFLLKSGRSFAKCLHNGLSVSHRKGQQPILKVTCRHRSTYARPASQFQRSHDSRSRYQDDDDDYEEYDVEEDNLDDLRKQHRASATKDHLASEGDFPLNDKLLQQLDRLGYTKPFEIQVETLKHTLDGRDVIARALTGSGKTLAFSIPIVHKILERGSARSNRSPKAIVISPTRELCLQIHRSIEELDPRIKCVAVYGGASIQRQEQEMRRGVDVICATPGRLNDHLQRGLIDLNELEFLCLDEADELLTPNFKEQIKDVLGNSPGEKQVMLFSATLPPEIKSITRQYMGDPVHVDITQNQQYKAPESVKHLCMRLPAEQHLLMVKHLIEEHKPQRCIVFMETKHKTREAAQYMQKQLKIRAEGINSDLTQSRRENIMSAFRAGKVEVLVATDVAARGLDIPEVDLVIQVTPPKNGTEYYIHRSGRTGRAGREGLSILLHSGHPTEWPIIKEIEKLAKIEHTRPANYEVLIQETAKQALQTLELRKHSKLTESLIPLVEKLDIGGEDGQRLLAAALGSIVSGNRSSARPQQGTAHSYDRPRGSFTRNDGFRNKGRPQRHQYGVFANDDYEDRSPSLRERRHRPRQQSNNFYGYNDD